MNRAEVQAALNDALEFLAVESDAAASPARA
jgi:hypothetical protein